MQAIADALLKVKGCVIFSFIVITFLLIYLPVYPRESVLNILLFDFEQIGGDKKYYNLEQELPIELKNCLNQSIKTNVNVERFEEIRTEKENLLSLPPGEEIIGFPTDNEIRRITENIKVDYNYILAGRFWEKFGIVEVEVRLIDCQTNWIGCTFSIKESEIAEGRTVQERLAENLAKRVQMYFVGRIRIGLIDFKMTGGDSLFSFLKESIPTMLATGLSTSRGFKLIETKTENLLEKMREEGKDGGIFDPSTYLEVADRINANYLIMGAFWEYKGKIRIDARCVSIETAEIILSEGINLEDVEIKKISEQINELASKIRIMIEKDFLKREKPAKSITVISFAPSPNNKRNRMKLENIRKTMVRKLRMVSDLRVKEDPEQISRYLKVIEDRLKICSDMGVSSLLTLQYEEYQDEFIILDIDLYDMEKPTQKLYTETITCKYNELDEIINEIIFNTLKYLKNDKSDEPTKSKIKAIRIPDIRYTKGLGIRTGASSHEYTDIYYDKNSTPYIELYISYLVPNVHAIGFDFGIEPSFGIDMVKPNYWYDGVVSANGFLNVKAVFSGWQYAHLPLILSFGGGVGGQGIRYDFTPGKHGYLGDRPYANGDIEFATNLFIKVEFPIIENFRFHALLRKISEPDEITTFETLKLDFISLDIDKAPVGKLGGYYFVFGLKYAWR